MNIVSREDFLKNLIANFGLSSTELKYLKTSNALTEFSYPVVTGRFEDLQAVLDQFDNPVLVEVAANVYVPTDYTAWDIQQYKDLDGSQYLAPFSILPIHFAWEIKDLPKFNWSEPEIDETYSPEEITKAFSHTHFPPIGASNFYGQDDQD